MRYDKSAWKVGLNRYLCFIILFLCSAIMWGQNGGFDPTNPPEPEIPGKPAPQYSLSLQANLADVGTLHGAGNYEEGKRIRLSMSINAGFKFISWNEGEQVVSTSSSFYYTMGNSDVVLTAIFQYDPSNPQEPQIPEPLYNLSLSIYPPEAGSVHGAGQYKEGANAYVYTYANSGFRFKEWRNGDAIVSTQTHFYYKMSVEDASLTAYYEYDPGNPGDPQIPGMEDYALISLSQKGDPGQTIIFPVYLLNNNIEVTGAGFTITFPEGVIVNSTQASLSSRKNGHTFTVSSLENNSYVYTISSENNQKFHDSNGILINIPVTLPATGWSTGINYPVTMSESTITTPSETKDCPFKHGSLSVVKGEDHTINANFHTDIFLNRVKFLNLSSENAESFNWNFGDGSASKEKSPLHVYTESGSYDVTLIASNSFDSDTISMKISISPENTWNISGVLSLNKNLSEAKNFTDATELFGLISSVPVTGDVIIQTGSGQLFEVPLSVSNVEMLSAMKNNLASSKKQMYLRNDGSGTPAIIDFTEVDASDPEHFKLIVELGKYIQLNGVEVRIWGNRIDINHIYDYSMQRVCTGHPSLEVNFKEIGEAFNYNWDIIKDPISTTGYLIKGTEVIPATELINESDLTDTLIYNVTIALSNIPLYVMEYRILVIPILKGELNLLTPASEEILTSTSVNFSWTPVNTAIYDLYVWNSKDDEPAEPFALHITTNSFYNNSYCKFGESYKWKVVAKGECSILESDIHSFSIKQLPDLEVKDVIIPNEVTETLPFTVSATVINNGYQTFSENGWRDGLYISKQNVFNFQTASLVSAVRRSENLENNESYNVEFTVNAPTDWGSTVYYFVRSDIDGDIPESDEDNNVTGSGATSILPYMIHEKDYSVLCNFYDTTAGVSWKRKWNVASGRIPGNWQGVTFENGRAVSIILTDNNLTGEIPEALFSLTYLREINFSNNRLSGDLNKLFAANILPDSLISINLSRNSYKGAIPVSVSQLTKLKELNLSYNSFDEVEGLLPETINLDISYQTLGKDSIQLSLQPELDITSTLSKYDHTNQTFELNPIYDLYANGRRIESLYYEDGKYYWREYRRTGSFNWNFSRDSEFSLVQTNGSAYGSSLIFKMPFESGDANIDQETDVLDVQHSLNYIFMEYPKVFNFIAADTYVDNTITVQDIVCTINLILNSDPDKGKRSVIRNAEQTNNCLFIENEKLVLYTEKSVAAMDITLQGLSEEQIQILVANSSFQIVSKNIGDGVRFILFSPVGETLSEGTTVIANLKGKDIKLVNAKLSDAAAERIPVKLNENTTGIEGADLVDQVTVTVYADDIYYSLPFTAEAISACLYSPQGVVLSVQESKNIEAGQYKLEAGQLEKGIYILQLNIKTGGRNIIKNSKLIISK